MKFPLNWQCPHCEKWFEEITKREWLIYLCSNCIEKLDRIEELNKKKGEERDDPLRDR